MYREDYILENNVDYLYKMYSLKFVEYIERIGLEDKIVSISSQQLKESVTFYSKEGLIQSVSTMDTYLYAIKNFFTYLFKIGRAENIFNHISDYDEFRQEIILGNNLKETINREYIDSEYVNVLLDYFNNKDLDVIMRMMGFFFKITLLAPAKRNVIANLRISDFAVNFSSVKVNDIIIKLPRALSNDITEEIQKLNQKVGQDALFFRLFYGSKYNDGVFNRPFCKALKDVGYNVPEEKKTYPVEIIRNTGIVNMIINGTNMYLISKISGITLVSLDLLIKNYSLELAQIDNAEEKINQELYKLYYYLNI